MNLQSGIGCLMLVGIVVNNAILLVDQAGRLRRDGLPTDTALIEAGRHVHVHNIKSDYTPTYHLDDVRNRYGSAS